MLATLLQVPRKTFWRLQHRRKSREKLSGVCNTVASPTKNFLAFATPLQVPRKTFRRLQHRCKSHEKLSGVCNTVANRKNHFLALAPMVQALPKTFWPSRSFRRDSLLALFLYRARVTRVSERLRYAGRWPRYHSAVRRAYPDGFLRCTALCEGSGNASGGGR